MTSIFKFINSKLPGPGKYKDQTKVFSKVGGALSRGPRSTVELKTPGPGNYDFSSKPTARCSKWSLSKSSRNLTKKNYTNTGEIGPG